MKKPFGLVVTWIVLALSSFLVKVDGAEPPKVDHSHITKRDHTSSTIETNPEVDEEFLSFNSTTTIDAYLGWNTDSEIGRNLGVNDYVDLDAAYEESKRYRNGLRKYGNNSLKDHFANYLAKVLKDNMCRKDNRFDCKAEYSPFKTNCNLGVSHFCASSSKVCGHFVVEVALDILDVLSNFFPPGKFIKAVKGVYMAAKKGKMIMRARKAILNRMRKEVRDEMLENLLKKLSKEEIAKSLMDHYKKDALEWLVDKTIDEALDDMATIAILKEQKKLRDLAHDVAEANKPGVREGNKIATWYKDTSEMTREDEWKYALELTADMDPTGAAALANKLFIKGDDCNDKKATKYYCQYGGLTGTYENAKKRCCAGAQNPSRRLLRERNLSPVYFGDEVRYNAGTTSCNLANGDIGCARDQGVVVGVYPTTFSDAQVRHYSELDGPSIGVYFHVPGSSQTMFRKHFGGLNSRNIYCRTSNSETMKKLCLDENDEQRVFRRGTSDYNACVYAMNYYFNDCEVNAFGPKGSPHEVRQCRGGKTIWRGKILMFDNWWGRRFGPNSANFDDWESGDQIIPIKYCCPTTGYDAPKTSVWGCGRGEGSNNKYWASRMITCDWVKKNPYHRCDAKSSNNILASHPSYGCRDACQSQCRPNKPSIEPNVGSRIDAIEYWGNKEHPYFFIKKYAKSYGSELTWAYRVWKEMGVESIKSNDGKYDMYELQHCRKGKLVYKGFLVGFNVGSKNSDAGLLGRHATYNKRLNHWIEGDVIIPVGPDFDCGDTTHTGKIGTYNFVGPPPPPTKPPTNAPTHPASAKCGNFINTRKHQYAVYIGKISSGDNNYCVPSNQREVINRNKSKWEKASGFILCRFHTGLGYRYQGQSSYANFDINKLEGKFPLGLKDGDIIYPYGLGRGGYCLDKVPTAEPTKSPVEAPKAIVPKVTPVTSSGSSSSSSYSCNVPRWKTHRIGIIVASAKFNEKFCVPQNQKYKFGTKTDWWEKDEWVICKSGSYSYRKGYVNYELGDNYGEFQKYWYYLGNGDVLYPYKLGGTVCCDDKSSACKKQLASVGVY